MTTTSLATDLACSRHEHCHKRGEAPNVEERGQVEVYVCSAVTDAGQLGERLHVDSRVGEDNAFWFPGGSGSEADEGCTVRRGEELEVGTGRLGGGGAQVEVIEQGVTAALCQFPLLI